VPFHCHHIIVLPSCCHRPATIPIVSPLSHSHPHRAIPHCHHIIVPFTSYRHSYRIAIVPQPFPSCHSHPPPFPSYHCPAAIPIVTFHCHRIIVPFPIDIVWPFPSCHSIVIVSSYPHCHRIAIPIVLPSSRRHFNCVIPLPSYHRIAIAILSPSSHSHPHRAIPHCHRIIVPFPSYRHSYLSRQLVVVSAAMIPSAVRCDVPVSVGGTCGERR